MQRIFIFLIVSITVIIFIMLFIHSRPLKKEFLSDLKTEFSTQPLLEEEILAESRITRLPAPVQRYLRYTGAIGKPVPRNFYIEFDAEMFRNPGDKPMKAVSRQYNFIGNPARIFFMEAEMLFIPFHAFHSYKNQNASFIVRVASLFNAVNLSGEDLTAAETVTLLNDICLFAPAMLIDRRFTWEEIDRLSSRVTFTNGSYKVSAVLYFNEKSELVNFVSDDRSALQNDGKLRKARWSTPVSEYREFEGRRILTYGEAIWNYPEGDFTYGKFTLKNISYNVKGPQNGDSR
ncbi:MAG TPA: hypothetical protein P5120_05140 [Spirochaetota bacterium]|nr:hypothetical protein [Spirochaetota bacterium]HPF06273.1 hypothetical protein [Spirochaetota bacterium]HPJ43011.1 hypothetical protein [Spirochaetota bacterium]HRX46883.1 hypothetical protein [Spirochaetota bacterium]